MHSSIHAGPLASLALFLPFLWAAPAVAQEACLLNMDKKICAQFNTVLPEGPVQPSDQGGTPTYVYYTLTLTNFSKTTTRFVSLELSLSPQSEFASINSPGGMCTVTMAGASCLFDKLEASQSVLIQAIGTVPVIQSPSQPDYDLVSTASFGWMGNQASTSASTTVSVFGGSSYVPVGMEVTLVTGPENSDPSLQTGPDQPLWAKLTIPAYDESFTAKIEVVGDGPLFECPMGIFVGTHPDDVGVYVCRDPEAPRRWVRVEFSENWVFPENDPLRFDVIWDASIVPALQLPPTPLTPTGTPPFAVFFRGGEDDAETRAFAKTCDSNAPPCLVSVEQLGSGDWAAVLHKRTVGAEGSVLDAEAEFQGILCSLPGMVCSLGILDDYIPIGTIK
jgi:hypothetical protein